MVSNPSARVARLWISVRPVFQLEKFKFVLDFKIKELKRQIEPRETEIGTMKEHIRGMDKELEQVFTRFDGSCQRKGLAGVSASCKGDEMNSGISFMESLGDVLPV